MLAAVTGVSWAQAGGGPIAPPVTPDVRVGDLRAQFDALQPGALSRATGPAWLVSPSISVSAGLTDNALQVERPRQADVFTVIAPAVVVSGDTARLKVNASYSPQIYVYASTSSQTRVDQFFNGQAVAAIVPDAVFLDLRGAISQQSRSGGFGRNTTTLNQQDQVQSITLSATPYAVHRFGGWGTGRIGYSIAQTFQDARANSAFNQGFDQNGQLVGTRFGDTGNLTTQRERASFTTGENLGRFNNISVVEAVQYDGFGPYRNAHRNTVSTDFGYAVTRTITLLAGTGYQDLKFSGQDFAGQPGIRINEPIWNVGVRLQPNPNSSITVGYGRRDGANSVFLDGSYSPTARTRVFARYSSGITTDSEEQQNLLQASSVGPTGLVTDTATGAPVSSSSSFFGTQNGLFRSRRLSVTGLLQLNRDSFSASVVNEERTNLSSVALDPSFNSFSSANFVVLPPGSNTNGTYGTLTWQHELSPVMTSTASFQYGVESFGQGGASRSQPSTTSVSATAALGYQFTETLSGSARYSFTERTGGPGQTIFGGANGTGNVVENQVLVSLRKSF